MGAHLIILLNFNITFEIKPKWDKEKQNWFWGFKKHSGSISLNEFAQKLGIKLQFYGHCPLNCTDKFFEVWTFIWSYHYYREIIKIRPAIIYFDHYNVDAHSRLVHLCTPSMQNYDNMRKYSWLMPETSPSKFMFGLSPLVVVRAPLINCTKSLSGSNLGCQLALASLRTLLLIE